ncbi:PP2C family protein-serine/threonine phosphatase [Aeromicrobium sp.]|uniref:PP2C family protein-serine/threonine phosphatase n=1 Tax=Aeromicrobium sp. TaxID=1871063 RepID=UPI0039E472B5
MAQTSGVRWTPQVDASPAPVITAAGASHPGAVRAHNEDAWLVGPPIFLVADGMGGHSAGDVASRLVVESFADLRDRPSITVADIEQAVGTARTSIAALATDPDTAPGSTLIAAGFVAEGSQGYWLVANIGDSRAYVLSESGFEQISRDHSVVQEMIDAGEIDSDEARVHPERHVITRAIGAMPDSPPEFVLIPVVGGSRLLLCSDGLSGELSDAAIERILRDGEPPSVAVARLVAGAVEAGGHDNVTAVVVDVVDSGTDRVATTLGHSFSSRPTVDTIPTKKKAS